MTTIWRPCGKFAVLQCLVRLVLATLACVIVFPGMLGLACYLLCELGVNEEAQDGQVVVHLNDDHLIVARLQAGRADRIVAS